MNDPKNPGNPSSPDGDLSRYEPTNRPEDQPAFGQQGAGGYAGYQAAGGPRGVPTGTFGGRPRGQVNWSEAMTYGFKATFANPQVWILGSSLCVFAIIITSVTLTIFSFGGDPSVLAVFSYAVFNTATLILTPFVIPLALHEVDKGKATWSDFTVDVHLMPAIVVSVLIGSIKTAIALPPMILASIPLAVSYPTLGQLGPELDSAMMLKILAPFFVAILLILIIFLFIAPLFQFMVWYAASGQADIWSAITAGFRLGRTHYVQLLIYTFLMAIISIVIVLFTFGLGLIVTLPVSWLSQAHLFRQMAGNMPARNA